MEITRLFIDAGAFIATELPRDQYYQQSRLEPLERSIIGLGH